MRAPRYRFPDEVRFTTRDVASQMIEEGAVAQTPEELHLWIMQRPEVRVSLENGGYTTAFTAHDLHPPLEVFVEKGGGPVPEAEAPARSSGPRWHVAALALLALMIVLFLLVAMTGAAS